MEIFLIKPLIDACKTHGKLFPARKLHENAKYKITLAMSHSNVFFSITQEQIFMAQRKVYDTHYLKFILKIMRGAAGMQGCAILNLQINCKCF